MENKTYKGWTNYETWNVKLWLDNSASDQEMQQEWLKQACAEPKHDYWTKDETIRFTLADIVKSSIEDVMPEIEPSMFSDLLSAALGRVEWQEIADVIYNDYKTECAIESLSNPV
jgi:hypothetical protein